MWGWIKENSSAIQAVAAVLVILASLYAGGRLVLTWVTADLTVRYEIADEQIPESARDWIKNSHDVFERYLAKYGETKTALDSIYQFEDIRQSELLERIDIHNSAFDKIRIVLINEKNEALSSVRLSVGRIYGRPVEALVSSAFLTDQEIKNIRDSILSSRRDEEYFAEIPVLPPNGQVTIEIFGQVSSLSEVKVSAVGAVVDVVPIVSVEKSGFTGFIIKPTASPWFMPAFFFVILSPLIIIIIVLSIFSRAGAVLEITRKAKSLVKSGRRDEAKELIRINLEHSILKREEVTAAKELSDLVP